MIKINHTLQSLFFFSVTIFLYLLKDFFSPLVIYFLLNITLLFNVLFYIIKLSKKYKRGFLLNPLVISLVINFLFFHGGITYFLLYEDYQPLSDVNSNINLNNVFYAKSGFLINMALIIMVFGYFSKIASNFNKFILNIYKRFSYREIIIKPIPLFLLICVVYIIKLYLLYNGLFGRLGEHDSALANKLAFLSNFTLIPILFSSYNFFKYNRTKLLFYCCLILELFFSFLEGARAPILSLSVLVFLVYYYTKNSISFKSIFYGLCVFIITFTVVTDFKSYIKNNTISDFSISGILTGYFNNMSSTKDYNFQEFKTTSFGRLNVVSELASAVQYKDIVGLKKTDPDFKKSFMLVPIQIFIPNSLLGIKNYSFGDWFRFDVLKRGDIFQIYNVAFSPIGFLYLSGGYIYVIVGFFFYGFLLKSIENLPKIGFIGFVLFILLGSFIFQYKTNIPANLISFIRFLILLPVIFTILRLFKFTK